MLKSSQGCKYFSLGEEKAIIEDDVLFVLDLDSSCKGNDTLTFLQKKEKSGKIKYVPQEMQNPPRSAVITQDDAYFCVVRSKTIADRANNDYCIL